MARLKTKDINKTFFEYLANTFDLSMPESLSSTKSDSGYEFNTQKFISNSNNLEFSLTLEGRYDLNRNQRVDATFEIPEENIKLIERI